MARQLCFFMKSGSSGHDFTVGACFATFYLPRSRRFFPFATWPHFCPGLVLRALLLQQNQIHRLPCFVLVSALLPNPHRSSTLQGSLPRAHARLRLLRLSSSHCSACAALQLRCETLRSAAAEAIGSHELRQVLDARRKDKHRFFDPRGNMNRFPFDPRG